MGQVKRAQRHREKFNVWCTDLLSDSDRDQRVSLVDIQTDPAPLCFPRNFSVAVQAEGGPEAVKGEIRVMVPLTEPCFSDG